MRLTPLFLAGCAALGLAACSETREVMGLNNTPPDEFAVVDHPPLSMPPDYALHPPRPGEAPAVASVQPAREAAQALYGADKMQATPEKGSTSLHAENLSSSEQALVQSSGATQADPHVRSEIDRESSQQVVANRKLIDEIMFWKPAKKVPPATVDAIAEHQRIEAAKSQNLPVTSGATPVVDNSGASTVQ